MDVIRRVLAVLLLSTALQAQNVPPAQTSGSLASTASVPLNVSGYASVAFQITGTWVGTITFEGSIDAVTYQALNVTPTNSSSAATTTTANGVWTGSVGGLRSARARMSAYTSGTAVITIQAAASGGGSGGGGGGGSGPSGTIGAAVPATASPVAVKDNAGNLAYPTLDVSGNLLVAVTGAGSGGTSSVDGSGYTAGTTAGTPLMGARDDAGTTACAEDKNCIARVTSARALMVDASGTTQPVSGTFFQATQPISAAALPLPALASTSTKQSDGSQKTQVVDGSGNVIGATANALDINIKSGNPTTITATQGTGTNLHTVVDSGTITTVTAVTAITNALPPGANAIGKLAANSGVDIGDVDVTSQTGVGSTGSAPPATGTFAAGIGSGATGGLLVGVTVCDTPKAISITSATTTLMITGVSGRHVYICHVDMLSAIANNVAPISGTGATCGTGTTGVAGGTTAANGYNFAANGGIAMGGGLGWIWRTTSTGDSICLITSAAGPLAGSFVYAIY